MSGTLAEMVQYSREDFLSRRSSELQDETVRDVFKALLGFSVTSTESVSGPQPCPNDNERTAIVGFSGSMRGYCGVRINSAAACAIASAMLGGMSMDENDESIDDATGEICNMIAGGWKNRVPELSSRCSLSPPTVISGRHYRVHTVKPSATVVRTYLFGSYSFQLILNYEQQAGD